MNELPSTLPRLESPRLVLRAATLDDVDAIARLAGRKEIADTTATIPHPYTKEHARHFVENQGALLTSGKAMVFVVERKADRQLVGNTGIKDLDPVNNQAEMGFWIGVEHWRQGYATEAAGTLLNYAFDGLGLNRVAAHFMVRNPASGRVLEKIGMRREGLLRERIKKWGVFEDVVTMAILRSDRAH